MGRPVVLVHENLQERRGLEFHQTGVFPGQGGTRGGTAPLRRAVSPASHCSSQNRHRRDRAGREVGRRGAAARRRGGHGVHRGGHGAHLRPQDRLDGGRTDEDGRRVQRRHIRAGRILPQGAPHAFGRRASDPHQDRRPAAQHAYAGVDAHEQADQDHGRDDLPLRAAGLPAGPLFDQERAGGPLHEVPLPAAVRRNHAEVAGERGVAPGVHRQIQRPDRRRAQPRQLQLRDFGSREERLFDLVEDAAQANPLRGDLRPVRRAHRLQAAAVPLGKDAVLADLLHDHRHLHPQARPAARLDFDAQGQRLRSAALDGDGARRRMGRSADPHAAHGGHRRTGIRRALEIQARHHFAGRGRIRQVAQADTGGAEQSDGKRRGLPR